MERERRSRKRAKRQSRPEILGRYVRIEASKQSVGLRADRPRGQPPALATSASVELRGRLDEPVANVTEARITGFPDPAADVSPGKPPAIGAIIGMKPCLQVVVTTRMWSSINCGHWWLRCRFAAHTLRSL